MDYLWITVIVQLKFPVIRFIYLNTTGIWISNPNIFSFSTAHDQESFHVFFLYSIKKTISSAFMCSAILFLDEQTYQNYVFYLFMCSSVLIAKRTLHFLSKKGEPYILFNNSNSDPQPQWSVLLEFWTMTCIILRSESSKRFNLNDCLFLNSTFVFCIYFKKCEKIHRWNKVVKLCKLMREIHLSYFCCVCMEHYHIDWLCFSHLLHYAKLFRKLRR
jgi:hypothetical protein